MKILQENKPEEFIEIRITRKYHFCKNDRRSYLSAESKRIMVTEATHDEVYYAVYRAIEGVN